MLMEPFEKATALARAGEVVAVGPEGGDARGLAGVGRTVSLVEGSLGFLLLPLHPKGVEVIIASARAKEVRVALFHAPGEAKVSREDLAEQAEVVGCPATPGATEHPAGVTTTAPV
jgi:hypothetical protein